MSYFTDSLKELYADDDARTESEREFLGTIIRLLENAEENVRRRGDRDIRNAYWQGRKDALRTVLAVYLNEPNISEVNASSTFADLLKNDVTRNT